MVDEYPPIEDRLIERPDINVEEDDGIRVDPLPEPYTGVIYTFPLPEELGIWILEASNDNTDVNPTKNNLPGRKGAFNQAKRDANIPKSQQPDIVEKVPMRSAQHEGGHVIKDVNGNIIYTSEYHYTNVNGEKIIIQDHSAGHIKGNQGAHFNVRPADNSRTGSVLGTQDHYPFINK